MPPPFDQDQGSDSALREAVDRDATSKVKALSVIRRNSFAEMHAPAEKFDYTRVHIKQPEGADSGFDADTVKACVMLDKAMTLRKRWQEYMVISDPEEAAQAQADSPVNSPRRGFHAGNSSSAFDVSKQRRRSPEFNPFAVACPPASEHTFRAVDGVYQVTDGRNNANNSQSSSFTVPSVAEFYRDMAFLTQVSQICCCFAVCDACSVF